MSMNELFLLALLIIFFFPLLIWRVGRTDYYAPLAIVQTIAGIGLGPGLLGVAFPDFYKLVFCVPVLQSLNGIASWAVMIFVMIAGIELDLEKAWEHRTESAITASFALLVPLLFGSVAAVGLSMYPGWTGSSAMTWQFVLGVGMSCAVTSLPVLVLLMEKLEVLRDPVGQRVLRYASLDDIALWCVLAVILLDWNRIGRQMGFLLGYGSAEFVFRKMMVRLEDSDRWHVAFIWLAACSFTAEWGGLHFIVGAFLAGAVMDKHWFDQKKIDMLRHHILVTVMPVYFLTTGLKTHWTMGGVAVIAVAVGLLIVSVAGKLAGVHIAGRVLKWPKGEAQVIGWLLQTKGLIGIVFVSILMDKGIITGTTFSTLLLVAIASTMLTTPTVYPGLQRMRGLRGRSIHLFGEPPPAAVTEE